MKDRRLRKYLGFRENSSYDEYWKEIGGRCDRSELEDSINKKIDGVLFRLSSLENYLKLEFKTKDTTLPKHVSKRRR